MSVLFMRSATPILLQSIRDGQLVLDSVVRQVLLEVVGQVFASVVSAQHF